MFVTWRHAKFTWQLDTDSSQQTFQSVTTSHFTLS